ncbi:GspE/PulE family protein [Herbaspirillum huttiense]|uniref:GspE/PulE family protein n=1 Tax=Herbaspirillum huttiense TaxID=863372 RepID=UPI0037FC78E7
MDASVIEILSLKAGDYFVPQDHREKVCLLSDGTLMVSQSYATDMWVLSYVENLKHSDFGFEQKTVSTDEVKEAYGGASSMSGHSNANNTHRQNQVTRMIREAVGRKASDIHFRVQREQVEVWYRIDGRLLKAHTYSLIDGHEMCATLYSSMCDVAKATFIPSQSQRARVAASFVEHLGVSGARIESRPTDTGYLMVLRLFHRVDLEKMSISGSGYMPSQEKLLRKMLRSPLGVNIFSGPTGSGKSTSLQLLMTLLLRAMNYELHLLTIEDPPEYPILGAVQTPILARDQSPAAVSAAWTEAISNAVRLDPDTMMVGEMGDVSAAMAAMRLAMTGHPTWTTLHANDCIQILQRLEDMGAPLALLTDSSIITGLINQSLVRKLCECKVKYTGNEEIPEDLHEHISQFCEPSNVYLKRPGGCPKCDGSGEIGRTVLAEVCIPNQELMDVFKRHGKVQARRHWVNKMDGVTKTQHLISLINQGLVDPDTGSREIQLDQDARTL